MNTNISTLEAKQLKKAGLLTLCLGFFLLIFTSFFTSNKVGVSYWDIIFLVTFLTGDGLIFWSLKKEGNTKKMWQGIVAGAFTLLFGVILYFILSST